jgi:hypothetical protein
LVADVADGVLSDRTGNSTQAERRLAQTAAMTIDALEAEEK